MSENLDLVRSIVEAWERGDFTSAEWADDKIEFVLPDGPDPGSWTGIAAMGEAWGRRISTAEGFRIAAEEFRELDDERVLVLTPVGGRSKTTGLDLGQMSRKGATLFHISDRKVTRLVAYFDRDRAFADLGLEEEAIREHSAPLDLVERVRQIVAAMNARDFDAAVRFYAPDAVLDAEDAGVHEGRPAIRSFYEVWWRTYEDHRQEAEEIRDLGSCVVIAAIHMHGRLPDAPAFLEQRYAAVATWRDGLIEKQTNYLDIDEARAAASRLAQERE